MVELKNMNTKLNNKEAAMLIANKFQKRMYYPKLFFIIFGVVSGLAFIQKLITGYSFLDNKIFELIFFMYFFLGGIITVFLIIIAGICPYCHEFQKLNGIAISLDDNNATYSKGVSPFNIDYCSKCGNPLSQKAVEHVFNQFTDN